MKTINFEKEAKKRGWDEKVSYIIGGMIILSLISVCVFGHLLLSADFFELKYLVGGVILIQIY